MTRDTTYATPHTQRLMSPLCFGTAEATLRSKMASQGQGMTAKEEKLLKHAAQQMQRAKIPPSYKRKNAFVFVGLLSSVIGIYAYSMYAIQQEKIDFDKD